MRLPREDYLAARFLWSLILGLVCLAGFLWIDGRRALAAAVVMGPAALYFAGRAVSPYADRAYLKLSRAWRSSRAVREPGKFYCPDCARVLRDATDEKPVPRLECPACRGAWCEADKLLASLSPYGARKATWKDEPDSSGHPPPACPKCAQDLLQGGWVGLPISFAECAQCSGYWAPRVSLLWLDLNPPRR